MHIYFTALMLSANMTDYLVDIFGLDTMQLLWEPLYFLFDTLEAVFCVDLSPLWDRFFT